MSNVERHPAGTPSWVDLMTPDLEKARAFYGALLGWQFFIGPPETGHYTMCQVGGRNAAGMGQQPKDAPYPSAWNVYFAVDSVDDTLALVKKHGGTVAMEAMDVMEEGRMAFCADPTGAHFGLWQPKRHTGAGVVDQHGAMTWREVNTRDVAKARDFYAAVFGLESKKMEGMDYWTLERGGKMIAGVMQMNEKFPQGIPPHWMNYFAVSDTEAAVKKVGELGGQVRVPPFDTPYGRMAVVSDPAGAVFSVIQPPAKAP